MTPQIIGGRLRSLRRDAGLTQQQVADRVYLSRETVTNYEQGRHMPRPETLVLLADAFGVTLDFLVRGSTLQHREGRVLIR